MIMDPRILLDWAGEGMRRSVRRGRMRLLGRACPVDELCPWYEHIFRTSEHV